MSLILFYYYSVMIPVALRILFSHKPSQTPMISIGSIFVLLSLGLGICDVSENKVLVNFIRLWAVLAFSAQQKFG